MGSSKPKVLKTPFEQKQQQTQQQQNTFGSFSIADSPEAKDFLALPLDYGGGNYGGEAYKDYTGEAYKDYTGNAYEGIKNDFKFNIDPGVGRRTDLAEQGAANRWDSALMAGVPAFLREGLKQRELRGVRGQGAAEAQQAEYTRQNAQQQADYQSSLARARMMDASQLNRARFRDESERTRAGLRDASELERARMADEATRARTMSELERRRLLLPQILQTGGSSTASGSSSGFGTEIVQPQPGFWQRAALGAIGAGGQVASAYLNRPR